MNPLIVIPARSTSKGIPYKNFKAFCRRPLIDWTLDAAEALGAPYVITTDQEGLDLIGLHDREPADIVVSTRHGDTTPMIDIVQEVAEKVPGDPIILLQPTSPCRFPRDVRMAYENMVSREATGVCSLTPVPRTSSPDYVCRLSEDGHVLVPPAVRRQETELVYTRTGDFYITPRHTLFQHNSFYGPECIPYITFAPDIPLDTPDQWRLAEYLAPLIDPVRFE